MFGKNKTHEMVILLVDHLDKVLGAGERLGDAKFEPKPITPDMSADDIVNEHGRLREFMQYVRAMELTVAARVDKARTWSKEIRGRDANLKLMCSLFLTGSQALADAMEELGDPRLQDFNGGDQAILFLKSRALIPDHCVTIDAVSQFAVGEKYLVAGRIQLDALLDLCATFIETLDTHYNILGEAAPAAASADGDGGDTTTALADAASGAKSVSATGQ